MKKEQKTNKIAKEVAPKQPRDFTGIMGLLQVFVVVSIGYMGYIVILGTDGVIPKVMTLPALLWASVVVVCKFVKCK